MASVVKGKQPDLEWNRFVAVRLKEFPIYAQYDTIGFRRTNFHCQPGLEFHFTHTGRSTLILSDGYLLQIPHQLVLLQEGMPHQVVADQNQQRYARSVICVDLVGVRSLLPPADATRLTTLAIDLTTYRNEIIGAELWRLIEPICLRMVALYTNRPNWWQVNTLTLFTELVDLLQPKQNTGAKRDRADSLPEDWFSACVDYVNHNLGSDISLQRVARYHYVTPEHLTRTFQKRLGQSFHRYVLNRRIEAAARLLRELPDRQISSIACELGFRSLAHFSRTFTAIVGTSPTSYRQAARQRMCRAAAAPDQDH